MNSLHPIYQAFDELTSEYNCRPMFSHITIDPLFAGMLFWVMDNGEGKRQWGNTPLGSPEEVVTDIRIQLHERGWTHD